MNNLLFDNDEHKERETMETEKKGWEQREWLCSEINCKVTGSTGGNLRCIEQRETLHPKEEPGRTKPPNIELQSIRGEKEWEPCGRPSGAYILCVLWCYESSQTARVLCIKSCHRISLTQTGWSSWETQTQRLYCRQELETRPSTRWS